MTDIEQLGRWNRDISRAIASLGTEDFFPALVEAVNGQVRVSYPQVWLYHRDLPPRVLYHEIPDEAVASQIDEYLEGPYREDPFYQASLNQPRSTVMYWLHFSWMPTGSNVRLPSVSVLPPLKVAFRLRSSDVTMDFFFWAFSGTGSVDRMLS